VTDTGRWKEAIQRDDRGLGLQLIRAAMTDVEIDRTPGGTTVKLERLVSMRTAGGETTDARDDTSR